MGDPPVDHLAARPFRLDRLLEVQLGGSERHRGLENPVRQDVEAFQRTADAGEFLDVIVPRSEIGVFDRPRDRDAFLRVRLHVDRREPVALLAPHQRAAARVVAAYPVEGFLLDVGMILVIDEKPAVRRSDRVAGAVLDALFLQHLTRRHVLMGKLPRRAVRRGVVDDVPQVMTALEDQRFEALLAELLGGPPAGDSRADDDGVVGVRGLAFQIQIHGF